MENGKRGARRSWSVPRTFRIVAGMAVAGTLLLGSGRAAAERRELTDEKGNRRVEQAGEGERVNRLDRKKSFQPGELLVKFKPVVTEAAKGEKHRRHGARVVRSHKKLRLDHLRLQPGMTVEEALARYRKDPDVEYAEPNYLVQVQGTPNDPQFSQQWGLAKINAAAAWDLTAGSGNAVVAILDTGIDYTHPDLLANLWINSAETGGAPGADDDGNGYLDDIHGYNAVANNGDPKDDHYHGTHVAGIVGAAGNNAIGVSGVNWNVKLMACKFMNAGGSGTISDAIECLQYVKVMKGRGVNIAATNNSWGTPSYSQALYDAIAEQQEILFVAAAGNENSKEPLYPAGYDLPNIVSVAASESWDGKASYSNYNRWKVDLAAPGSNILSTMPGASYSSLSGTSMAAPHVSGLAALLWAQDGSRSAGTLKNLILAGGDAVTDFADITVTGRRINAYKSLTCTNAPLLSVIHLPQTPQPGVAQTIAAMSVDCGVPVGPVSVTLSGGQVLQLVDDGVAPDRVAGDGIFTGSWIPSGTTVESLSFSSPLGTSAVSSPPATIAAAPVVLLPATMLPDSVTSANIGTGFSQSFPVSGGIPPYSWSLVAGTLPAGLALNGGSGEIAGIPTATGIFNLTVQVSDALGVKDRKDWTLLLNEGLRAGWPRELLSRTGSGFLPVSYSPITADLDGDGKDEVIVSDADTLYLLNSDGTSVKTVLPGRVTTPAVADLDGDGVKEIVVSVREYYTSRNSIYAFHRDLTPVSGFPAGAYPTTNNGPGFVSSPVVADLDGDGKLEIAVIASPNNVNDPNYEKNVVIVVDSQGQMVPGWPQVYGKGIYADLPPAVGDLDRDGKQELVISTWDGYVAAFRSDGTVFGRWQFDLPVYDLNSPILADMDDDGFLDIVLKYDSSASQNILTVLDRNGARLPGWPFIGPETGSSSPAGPAVADIDGDGRPEVVAVLRPWNQLLALRGDGSALPNWPVLLSGQFGTPSFDCAPVVADVDGDGKAEVLITTVDTRNNGRLVAIDGNGGLVPGFPKNASVRSDVRSSAAIGDLDGNGKLDLVVKSENGYLYAFEMAQDAGAKNLQWPMFRNGTEHLGRWVPTKLPLSPGAFDFKSVLAGTVSAPVSFTIANTRFDPVEVGAVALSGLDSASFTLSLGSCGTVPFTLSPMQSCTATVSFAPTDGGAREAVLTVTPVHPGMQASRSTLAGNGLLSNYRLSYSRLGSGSGTVVSSTGTIYTASGSELVPVGGVVVLSAAPDAGSVFTGWEGACTGTGDCTVTVDRDQEVTATFEASAAGIYELSILHDGPGTAGVSYSPGGACPSLCTHSYGTGTVVSLVPALAPGALFAGWSGCDSVSGTTCTVTMNANRSVTARYRGIAAVAAGYDYSMGLDENGKIWAWGHNGWGQLGDGTKTQRFSPIQVPTLSNVIQLSGRTQHTAALKSDGTIWVWGNNGSGQLGDGTTTERLRPVQVAGLTGMVAVATGYHTLALKQDGTVWSWGYNGYGQVGDGSTTNRLTAAPVPGLTGVVAIAAGVSHSVALKGDGTVWAWGDNSVAQVGDGSSVSYRAIPVNVVGLTDVVAIGTGGRHSFAVKRDGTVWAWGYDGFGQLGVGGIYSSSRPVQIAGFTGAAVMTGGGYFSLSVKQDGSMAAWGRNESGQLGDGTTTQQNRPIPVPGLAGVIGAASGDIHSIAMKGDGTVWTWGWNGYGQLGDGSTTGRLVPVQVPGLNLLPSLPPSFTVTVTAGVNGTISGPTIVNAGANASYSITPAAGYRVADVVVDGASVGAVTSYTFLNVSANHTIGASFAALPDLTVNTVSGPGNVGRGKSMSVSSSIKNQGIAGTGSFTVSFYLSQDSLVTGSDRLLGSKTVGTLAAGSSITVSGAFAVPTATSPGRYYVGAIVDSGAVIVESDETNNAKAAGSTTNVK